MFLRASLIAYKTLKSANFATRSLVTRVGFWRPVTSFAKQTKKEDEEEDDLNKPIKFSTSPAAKWKAKTSRTGDRNPRLWYEPYVVIASLSVFMVYFLVLREENDIDQELSRSLYSRIEGLEEQQLQQSLEYNQERGLATSEIKSRLKEIEDSKLGIK